MEVVGIVDPPEVVMVDEPPLVVVVEEGHCSKDNILDIVV